MRNKNLLYKLNLKKVRAQNILKKKGDNRGDNFGGQGDSDPEKESLSGDFVKFNFVKIGTRKLEKNEKDEKDDFSKAKFN